MALWAIFLTGLTTGGISCVAMQGGLLASVVANQESAESDGPRARWLPTAVFLLAKLIAHTILGFLLGWVGSAISLSVEMRLVFQGAAALYILATAANLLDLHPVFRHVVFQPPRALFRIVKKSTRLQHFFAPALLGFFTIFIPCGVTQAMEIIAITSGNPVMGALTMAAFTLGTMPLFALVGGTTSLLSERLRERFLKSAALLLVFLAMSSFNGILVVLDAPLTWQKAVDPIVYSFSNERYLKGAPTNALPAIGVTGSQELLVSVTNTGYSPRILRAKAGTPVNLTLQTNDVYSCATSFVMKEFGIRLQLGPTDSQTVAFTPKKPGKYPFSCSMGMYTGTLEVI